MKRKTLSKLLALTLSLALTAGMLAGCGGSGNDKPADTKAADKTDEGAAGGDEGAGDADDGGAEANDGGAAAADGETITLTVVDWESDEMNAAMQEAFDTIFSVEHPNVKVEIVQGSYSDWAQQLASMITAGEAPDVFQGGYDMANSFNERGLLKDWGAEVASDSEFEDSFYEGTLDGWRMGETVYGFPSLVNVYGVFYNVDLLEAAGLEAPDADWTWDDLFEMAGKLADPSQNKYGLYGLETSAFGIANLSVANGGAGFMDHTVGTTAVQTDDVFLDQMTKIQGLIADGVLPPKTYDTAQQQSMFEAGEIAMIYYGQWEVDSLIRNCPDLNWGYAPTPQGPSGRATTYDTTGWMSPQNLEHPEETWELIKFMSGDIYETVLKATPVAPCANKNAAHVFYEVMEEAGHPEAGEAVRIMMETEQKNGVRYAHDWAHDVYKVWDPTFNNFMDSEGGVTTDDILDAVNTANQVIENN